MRMASLGSGSRGNSTLIATDDTTIMVDCGLPRKEVDRRLARLGVAADSIDAILLTHEHSDHCRGVGAFAGAYDIPVFLTAGTAASQYVPDSLRALIIRPGDTFAIGDMDVGAEPVPHDAREPVQFTFRHQSRKLGVLTDLGSVTPHLIEAYAGCDALLLEFNHDRTLLAQGPYPHSVKARVAGDFGHLANEQAREFLDLTDTSRLKVLFVAHISQQNNHPDLADAVLRDWEAGRSCRVVHASQEDGFDWYELEADFASAARTSRAG